MDVTDFETVFARQIEQSKNTLVGKAKEYADDTDRLHNFKVAAAMAQNTPKQACWGLVVKHLTSLSDMVKSDDIYPVAVWDEKIGDSINYLILLRALEFEADNEPASSIGPDPRHARFGDVHLPT